MNSAGRVWKALILSAVGLALAVAGAEGAFRLARLAAPGLFVGINTYADLQSQVGSYFRPETFIPFTLAPDYRGREMSQEYPGRFVSVNTNALGLRMHETTRDKPPGLRRVLTLGDSYTFGVYVGTTRRGRRASTRELMDGDPVIERSVHLTTSIRSTISQSRCSAVSKRCRIRKDPRPERHLEVIVVGIAAGLRTTA